MRGYILLVAGVVILYAVVTGRGKQFLAALSGGGTSTGPAPAPVPR